VLAAQVLQRMLLVELLTLSHQPMVLVGHMELAL